MSENVIEEQERIDYRKRVLIWFTKRTAIQTKKKHQPIYLQKKLARQSLMDRQLKILEDNGFLEVAFISNEVELLESLKEELKANQWEKEGFTFEFTSQNDLANYLNGSEKQKTNEIILNLSDEWLFDERIIRNLSEKMLKEMKNENNKQVEFIFIQEDRKEIQREKQHDLVSEEFLPLVGIVTGSQNTISKQLIREGNQEEVNKPLEKIITFGLKKSHKIITMTEMPTYMTSMRRKLPIQYYLVRERKDLAKVKWALTKQTQKGTLDFIAWYFNRPLENLVVYVIANLPVTPNQITILVNIIAFLVAGCFITSPYLLENYELTSRVLPWIGFIGLIVVNILDGVDGKLARIRGRLTLLGYIEHSFDQLYEQTVYFAACWYCLTITSQPLIPWLLLIVAFLIIDTFNRHVSMQYYNVMRISLADSGKIDRAFRRIDGRRNTYTIHILIFFLLPWKQFLVISMLTHATITGIVYATRAIQHLRKADKGIFPEMKKQEI